MNLWFVGALEETFLLLWQERVSTYFRVFPDSWISTLEIQVQIHLTMASGTLSIALTVSNSNPLGGWIWQENMLICIQTIPSGRIVQRHSCGLKQLSLGSESTVSPSLEQVSSEEQMKLFLDCLSSSHPSISYWMKPTALPTHDVKGLSILNNGIKWS